MAFEKLKEGLQGAINGIRKAVVFDKKAVREYVKELQKTLLSADVNVQLVLNLSKNIEEKALLEKPPGSLSRTENIVKITYDELVALLGTGEKLSLSDGQKIMLVGVQGSGKTTAAAKLARHYKKQGLNPKLICADPFRPAAYDQLKQLSEEINVPFYGDQKQKDSLKIINEGLKHFKNEGLLIIDSEGRHKLNEELMADLKRVHDAVKPDFTLLVLDATIGQAAKEQTKAFIGAMPVKGVVLTKTDGGAKGGGAISACAEAGASVLFLGTGEHIQDLEEFEPKRFVGKLLGYGDLEGLLEKAKEIEFDEDSAKRMIKGDFTLVDVYEQIEQMQKMGPFNKVLEMLPFQVNVPKDMLQMQEEKVKKFRFIMDSMTPWEKENPMEIKKDRIDRIAVGSGTSPEDVRDLLNYYKKMKKMMKGMGGRNMQKMMRKFGGAMPGM
ncbi:Signal recognition particle 54 kDa protein [uncultured archaeon]|nr:Signal recognition particle 54 kDa protein [uncultured archaeon]